MFDGGMDGLKRSLLATAITLVPLALIPNCLFEKYSQKRIFPPTISLEGTVHVAHVPVGRVDVSLTGDGINCVFHDNNANRLFDPGDNGTCEYLLRRNGLTVRVRAPFDPTYVDASKVFADLLGSADKDSAYAEANSYRRRIAAYNARIDELLGASQ